MANRKKYEITLPKAEQEQLEALLSRGQASAYQQRRARILLKVAQGKPESLIQEMLDVGESTIWRVKKQDTEGGLEKVLFPKKRERVYEKKLSGRTEAHLVQLACSTPPKGRAKWSVRLLAGKMVELGLVQKVGRETVRVALKKMNLSRT